MNTVAILFGPALLMALILGAVDYAGTDPGGVFGKSLPALGVGIVVFVLVFLADAAFLLLRWAWRSMT